MITRCSLPARGSPPRWPARSSPPVSPCPQPPLTAGTRYDVNGTADGRKVTIWRVSVPADPAREAVSFTSPATPNLKVFALSAKP